VRKGLVQVPADAELAVSSVVGPRPTRLTFVRSYGRTRQFAFDSTTELASESPGKNLSSSRSISYALAMTYAGARATPPPRSTRRCTSTPWSAAQLHVAFNALAQALLHPSVTRRRSDAAES